MRGALPISMAMQVQMGGCLASRAQLARILGDGATVADYQPGNFTGTLNASAWLNTSPFPAPSLAQGSGAAQPIILPFSGTKYAYEPGVSGNYFSTPNAAANNPAGDMALAVYSMQHNWASTGNPGGVVGKRTNANGSSYFFQSNYGGGGGNAGKLGFNSSKDGDKTSTVTTGFSNATAHWTGVTRTSVDGVIKFWTSADGVTWTQLGTDVAGTAGALTNHADAFEVGTYNVGAAAYLAQSIYRVKLFNTASFTGTPVLDFNPADSAETSTNAATFASSATGEVWTLNNTGALPAQIVGSPSLLGDGVAHIMQMTATIPAPYFVIEVAKYISWTSANVMSDGLTSNSFAAQQITGTPQVKMYDGTSLTASIAPTLNTYNIISAGQDAAGNATIQLNAGAAATGTLNATALAGWTEFGNGAGTKFGNKQIKERIILSAIPSAAKLAKVLALLKAIHGTP